MKKYISFFIFILFFSIQMLCALSKAPVDITKMSIVELQEAMEKGYLNSELLVNLYLDRINEYDEKFNSINQINETAIDEAKKLDEERKNGNVRGPLHGIPILVKANIDVKGLVTNAGSKALSDNYPINDSNVVKRLKEAGAIILGSTNMSEFAFSAANSYSSYGYVKNAFDIRYTSYGSSGGSAVALSLSFASASLGTDTNASVRLPASGAGVVGLRPTIGLIGRGGVIAYDIERDTVGIMSRTVNDNAIILEVLAGYDERDKVTSDSKVSNYSQELLEQKDLSNVTIGVVKPYVYGIKNTSIKANQITEEQFVKLLDQSIDKLKNDGANIVYIDKFLTNEYFSIAKGTYAGVTMCDSFNEYILGTTGKIRSFKELAKASGKVYSLNGYISSCGKGDEKKEYRDNRKAKYRDYVNDIFEQYNLDLIIYPTIKNAPAKYNDSGHMSPATSLGSVIGYPSITVPMGKDEIGFPYGIEFLAKAYEENIILNVSSRFEKVNEYGINPSPLTPALYVVPESVEELKVAYESALLMKYEDENIIKEINMFIGEVLTYFEGYSTSNSIDDDANKLLKKYEELNDFILESNKPKGIIKLVGHVFSFRNLIISFLVFIAFVIWYFFRVRKY